MWELSSFLFVLEDFLRVGVFWIRFCGVFLPPELFINAFRRKKLTQRQHLLYIQGFSSRKAFQQTRVTFHISGTTVFPQLILAGFYLFMGLSSKFSRVSSKTCTSPIPSLIKRQSQSPWMSATTHKNKLNQAMLTHLNVFYPLPLAPCVV